MTAEPTLLAGPDSLIPITDMLFNLAGDRGRPSALLVRVRRRRLLLVLVALTITGTLTGCTTTVAGSPTVAGDTGSGADVQVGERPDTEPLNLSVLALFVGYNFAWEQGIDSGAAYQAEHNHPTLDYSAQDCVEAYTGADPSYRESLVADPDTVVPDPDWTLTFGRFAGQRLDGFIFAIDVTSTHDDPTTGVQVVDVLTIHLAYLDGHTYFFYVCEYGE